MIRMMVCVVTVTVVVSIVIHTLLVPNEDPLRKATQACFPSPLDPMFLCANQNHCATTFCIIVCDGVSQHSGPTSVPTYVPDESKL